MPEKLEREIHFYPAYDKRDSGSNYGIGGVSIKFLLKGSKGTIQFYFTTNWYLKSVEDSIRYSRVIDYPMAFDIGYHAYKPQWKEQEVCFKDKKCEYLNDSLCYYDGSSLNAVPILEILIKEGHEAVWKIMEERYNELQG
jgi:hypothetical protein